MGAATLAAGTGEVGPPPHAGDALIALPRSAPAVDTASWLGRARAHTLAVLLDLDGTLIPFAATPEEGVLDRGTAETVNRLAATSAQIVIVSGRPQPQIEPLTALLPGAWWIAEHGAWRRDAGAWRGPPRAPVLDGLVTALASHRAPGTRLERKSLSVCVHWRGVEAGARDSLIAAVELLCDEWLETNLDYERIAGVEMLEVRHRSAHKGAAIAWVRDRLPAARLIAIGDDLTDEDMFTALAPDDGAIAVGHLAGRATAAQAHLPDPVAVGGFLRWLTAVRTGAIESAPPLDAVAGRRAPLPRRLVVVSNRMPTVPIAGRPREVGGLVSALEPALRDHDGIWLGWSGHERPGPARLAVQDDQGQARASFDLTPAWRERFYSGFCNRALWPLFHSFPGRVHYADADWVAYVEANDAYARFTHQLAERDGIVWIHDYHLLLVGRALRRLGHRGPIGLFLHVPFPGPDLFETLPWADELLDGLLAFDLVGLHTARWADNLRAAARVLGGATVDGEDLRRGEQHTRVGVFPLGVDAAAFAANGDATPAADIAGLKQALGNRKLILGVDRLDYSKGIPERLIAFELLLERYPAWRGQVSFVQISVPSRADVPEYAELRDRVENLVGRINGRFGEADWVPVRYLYRAYPPDVLAQLYRAADIGMVTPLRDGMNLVAKEFIAAQDATAPGVLVLSRFAGAALELGDAVLTNPYHADGLAADLDRALRMPASVRVARHERLLRAVARHAPSFWAASFLARLDESRGVTA